MKYLFQILVTLLILPNLLSSQNESKPNIVWLVAEDQSQYFFPFYGDQSVNLLNISNLLENGIVSSIGNPKEIVDNYIIGETKAKTFKKWIKGEEPGNINAKLKSISITKTNNELNFDFDITEKIKINIEYIIKPILNRN